MSWLFSRALVAEFSADTSWDGAPSAPLNVMPTPHKFWRNDKTMEPSRLSRFGLTCEPLTADRGEALLMWFRGGFLARTSVRQAAALALMAREADYGARWSESLATFDPLTSSWRTPQCSLFEVSAPCLATWPRSGSMRNGTCFLRPTLAPRTCGSAFGLWPTPTASLGTKGGRITPRKGREGGTLIEAVSARSFATPTARDWRSGKASQATMERNSRPLSEQVGGLLNPTWVEWLMGWPLGWTALQPLEMDKFLSWRQQHLPPSPRHSVLARMDSRTVNVASDSQPSEMPK